MNKCDFGKSNVTSNKCDFGKCFRRRKYECEEKMNIRKLGFQKKIIFNAARTKFLRFHFWS